MENSINIYKVKSVYFIGIGGVGMSSLALYFYANGCKVSGYDRSHSAVTDMLESKGIQINYHEDINNINEDIELVIYTPAIAATNVELAHVRQLELPIMKRAEVLSLICKGKYCIAVAGTHGKTTVTSMIANILSGTNIAFEAFVGGICKSISSNFYKSKGAQVVVVEADEYDRSFLQLSPDIAVVTSISADHLDVYGTEEELVKSFVQFASSSRAISRVVNYNCNDLVEATNTYGTDENAKFRLVSYEYVNGLATIVVNDGVRDVTFRDLPIYGKHNIENFCAAFAVANLLKLDYDIVESSMRKYKGVSRRFDVLYQDDEKVLLDDYAHHPEEIDSLITAVREIFPEKRICGFFQPHLFSRTQMFMNKFAEVLSKFDEMYLLDIYPARETPIEGVTSQALFDMMTVEKGGVIMKNLVCQVAKKSSAQVFVTIGAGNIDRLNGDIVEILKSR